MHRKTMIKTTIIKTYEALTAYFKSCESLVVFDSEDMGLEIEAPIIGFSFWDFKNDPVFAITNNLFEEGMPTEDLVKACNQYFPRFKAIGHNIKFDLGITKYNGIVDIPLKCDTSSMVHLFNPDLLKKLETRVRDDLGVDKKTYEQIMSERTGKATKWPSSIPEWHRYKREKIITLKSLADYAGEDAYYTGQLYLHYKPKLTADDWQIMERIEIPLIRVLRDAHYEGINVNLPYLKELDVELDAEIARLQKEIYEEAGAVFNLKSPKQVGEILFGKMGLPPQGKTASGQWAADSDVMKVLARKGYPIGQLMVDFSQVKTLSQNFVKSIPNLVSSDGRLRCSFNIDIARTGRLSSNSPNLQNQPNNKRFPVRKAYIPSSNPKSKLIVADLSQIELRVMAHCSGDKVMSKAFFDGVDIHQSVADMLTSITGHAVSRDDAKTLNFAIIYGMGPQSLALSLNISVPQAKDIIAGYQRAYKGYYRWKIDTEAYIESHRCVYNIFGRVRRLQYTRGDARSYYGALRRGVNTVIQGSAADIIKLNMIKVHEDYLKKKMRSKLLLTVHDELVVDSPENEIEDAYNILIHGMEKTVKLSVPIIAEGKVVNTWDEMKNKGFTSLLEKYKTQTIPSYLLNQDLWLN